jgi:ABC-type polysaccharide/polyol phosphate export permease
MLSRFLFTFIEVAALLCIARLAFGIVIQGNFLALLVMVIVGGLSFSAIGLLLASRAKTLETVSGLMNAIMLPMYLLSGVFFSYERFPEAIQPFIQALPLTAVIDGFRAIINDGGGFEAIVRPVTVLTLWGVGSALLAARLFRWR